MKLELDVNRELGLLMKAMRQSATLTQQQMADALALSRGQLANMEGGRITNILLQHLVKAGDTCGFDIKLTIRRKTVEPAPLPPSPLTDDGINGSGTVWF